MKAFSGQAPKPLEAASKIDKTAKNTLLIHNLPTEFEQEQLNAVFSKFGQVVALNLPMDKKSGKFLSTGTVQFSKQSECNDALKELKSFNFNSKTVQLSAQKMR